MIRAGGALWLTARELEPYWLPELQKGKLDFGGNARRLVFALQAVGSPVVVRPLIDLVRAGKVPTEREEGALTLIATLGGPQELAMILDSVVAGKEVPAGRQAALLQALAEASRQRKVRPAGELARLAPLLASGSDPVRSAAARTAGLWQVQKLQPDLLKLARAADTSEALRRAAFDGLAQLDDPANRTALDQTAGGKGPIQVRMLAVSALAALDAQTAAKRAAEVLAVAPAGVDPSEVFTTFLQRKEGPALLTKALSGSKLPADVGRVGVRLVRASGRDAPALIDALTKAASLTAGARVLTAEEMRQMIADVPQHGDPARGEAVYRRKELSCLKCHAVAGAGGQVGPDLTSIGASAPVDYLIDSLLQPNKAIKENYHSLVVAMKDGKVVTGVKVLETGTDLILRDAEDREVAVPLKAIDEKANGPSLMPEGLADSLTRAELLDLVRFLSELGKVGPYSVGQVRLMRRWEVLEPTTEARQLLLRVGFAGAAGTDPALKWSPAYSKVAGDLPLGSVPVVEVRKQLSKEMMPMSFVRGQVEVTTPGKVLLRLNATTGLTAWLDGTPVPVQKEMALDLTTGLHTLTFAVSRDERKEYLRLQLDDVPGSPARARIVGGK